MVCQQLNSNMLRNDNQKLKYAHAALPGGESLTLPVSLHCDLTCPLRAVLPPRNARSESKNKARILRGVDVPDRLTLCASLPSPLMLNERQLTSLGRPQRPFRFPQGIARKRPVRFPPFDHGRSCQNAERRFLVEASQHQLLIRYFSYCRPLDGRSTRICTGRRLITPTSGRWLVTVGICRTISFMVARARGSE